MALWDFTTTIRNPDRVQDFAAVAIEYDEESWDSGHQNQIDFQIGLIQNKLYLEEETVNEVTVTLEKAIEIAGGRSGSRWKIPHTRGRTSMSPLFKLGICYRDKNNIIHFTESGKQFANNEISVKKYFEHVLLKYQLPKYAEDRTGRGLNIIPVIATLQLIDKVNKLWQAKNHTPTGLSLDEFNLFVPSLIKHTQINSQAKLVIKFREEYRKASTLPEKKQVIDNYQKMFADDNLKEEWNNDDASDSVKEKIKTMKKRYKEYGDNISRYLRFVEWVHKRGNGFRIDLNPMRQVETEEILKMSCIPIQHTTEQNYSEYLSKEEALVLPWRTKKKLIEKYNFILKTISKSSQDNNITSNIALISRFELEKLDLAELDSKIEESLQELKRIEKLDQIQKLTSVENVCTVINNLKELNSIGTGALELEYETTRGLIALDNEIEIKPNYPVGDDGQPTNTANGGIGDIECFYEKFNLLCEVTLLTNRQQWMNEGVPVTRHYRDFTEKRTISETYCLFIAPKLHEDTISQYWFENQRSGVKQTKIIPITITQFIEILELLVELKQTNPQYIFKHEKLLKLYKEILDSRINFDDEHEWRKNIQSILCSWKEEILAVS